MGCDEPGCPNQETVYIVQPRPSNKSELVSILAFCSEHAVPNDLDYLISSWGGTSPCAATSETWNAYIETPTASERNHLWITL